jgi:hypothetical protein
LWTHDSVWQLALADLFTILKLVLSLERCIVVTVHGCTATSTLHA